MIDILVTARDVVDISVDYLEVPASWIHPRCANAHNCLGPTLGR